MECTQNVRTVKSVLNRIKKGNIRFDAYYQRQAGQWGYAQKSLLIDSVLRGIPVPGIYLEKKTNEDGSTEFYVIDGCQRLSTLMEYLNGEFVIQRGTPDIDDCRCAGKSYQNLPEQLQSTFNDGSLVLCIIESATQEEIVELFKRLNNGKPLTMAQKNKAIMEREMANKIADIAEMPVFRKFLSPTQLRRDEAQMVVVQSLMLLRNAESGFRAKQTQGFLANGISDEELQQLVALLERLDNILPGENYPTLKKTSVPVIIKTLSEIEGEGLDRFAANLSEFLTCPDTHPDYVKFCQARTTDKTNVAGRLAFFKGLAA